VRLLVTRPEPDGERTAQALRVRGHEVLVAALLRIEPVAFELADQSYDAVVLTSANAVRAVVRHPKRAKLTALPSLTVGRHTADAARAAGFRDVASADGDRSDLAALLRRRFGNSGKVLLHLTGEDRAGDLAACGVPVDTVVVYRAVKAKRLPPEIVGALGSLGGVLHFSRRSVEAYLACAVQADVVRAALAPVHFCLSRQVAEPLAAAGAADIRLASQPNEAALVALLAPWTV
jgi:uroporphyrinogen-III synthase